MEGEPPGSTIRTNKLPITHVYQQNVQYSNPEIYLYDERDETLQFENESDVRWNSTNERRVGSVPTPKTIANKRNDVIPSTLLVARRIQHKESKRLLRVLFDSGGSHTLIHSHCLPLGATPTLLSAKQSLQTVAGTFASQRQVYLEEILLPEFDSKTRIEGLHAYVFDAPCNYDVIVGRDLLNNVGIDLSFQQQTMKWMNNVVPMKQRGHWRNPHSFLSILDLQDNSAESFTTQLLDAKYEKVEPMTVAQEQHHLTKKLLF